MVENNDEILEIIDEQAEYRSHIKEVEEFLALGNRLKKFQRCTSQLAWDVIVKNAKEDFPFVEVKK